MRTELIVCCARSRATARWSMRPEAEAWVAAAEADYELALQAAVPPEIDGGVCFHAPQ